MNEKEVDDLIKDVAQYQIDNFDLSKFKKSRKKLYYIMTICIKMAHTKGKYSENK